MQSLQSLQRLERLERLENKITVTKGDYKDVKIKPNSVIYCDIPYKDTEKYGCEFNYEEFYDWAMCQSELIFISEYDMPNDFVCIAQRKKKSLLCVTDNTQDKIEKIFIPKTQEYRTSGELW